MRSLALVLALLAGLLAPATAQAAAPGAPNSPLLPPETTRNVLHPAPESTIYAAVTDYPAELRALTRVLDNYTSADDAAVRSRHAPALLRPRLPGVPDGGAGRPGGVAGAAPVRVGAPGPFRHRSPIPGPERDPRTGQVLAAQRHRPTRTSVARGHGVTRGRRRPPRPAVGGRRGDGRLVRQAELPPLQHLRLPREDRPPRAHRPAHLQCHAEDPRPAADAHAAPPDLRVARRPGRGLPPRRARSGTRSPATRTRHWRSSSSTPATTTGRTPGCCSTSPPTTAACT